jgi:hypothetical protein
LSCQQELNVIVFVYFLRVHSLSLITLYQLRKSYNIGSGTSYDWPPKYRSLECQIERPKR